MSKSKLCNTKASVYNIIDIYNIVCQIHLLCDTLYLKNKYLLPYLYADSCLKGGAELNRVYLDGAGCDGRRIILRRIDGLNCLGKKFSGLQIEILWPSN